MGILNGILGLVLDVATNTFNNAANKADEFRYQASRARAKKAELDEENDD